MPNTSMTPVLQELANKAGMNNPLGALFDRDGQIQALADQILTRVLNGVTAIEIQNCLSSDGESKEIQWTCQRIREQIKKDFGKE